MKLNNKKRLNKVIILICILTITVCGCTNPEDSNVVQINSCNEEQKDYELLPDEPNNSKEGIKLGVRNEDGIYTYACNQNMISMEQAVDLVAEIVEAEILVQKEGTYQYWLNPRISKAGDIQYLSLEEWEQYKEQGIGELGEQLIINKIECRDLQEEAKSNGYYEVIIYEDIIDDIETGEGHKAITRYYAVDWKEQIIVEDYLWNDWYLEFQSTTSQPNGMQGGYDSFLDFPYDDMHFVSDDIYEKIREEYHKINFSSEFKIGNLELYDSFKEKFKQLLDNKRVFVDKKGNELFLNEFSPEAYEDTSSTIYSDYDVNDFEYYFFDMDEDDSPELCIVDHIKNPSIYIFKYIPDKDNIILWYEMTSLWIRLIGSKTLGWNREGTSQVFYKLDENGDEVCTVSFFEREDYNRRINQAEVVYLAALPDYTDKNVQIEITEQIRQQAYYDRGQKWYYFRVSEEQYHELTKDYFKAEKLANENIEKVSYSYDELFNK